MQKQRFFTPLLFLGFFLTGMCGLMYEIVWLRVLSLVFGNTTFATSVVLASYMGGLGLGSLYFGRMIDRSKTHPIRFYAFLEGGVALYALITPLLWRFSEWLSIGFYRSFEPGYMTFNLFQFAVAFVLLFPPTFLMGGTLPIVASFFVKKKEETARYVGLLYALNTFGAVAGVIVSAFYAIYHIGVWQTLYLAALINFVIFLAFKNPVKHWGVVDSRLRPSGVTGSVKWQDLIPRQGMPSKRPVVWLLMFLFGVSGAVSMLYEVGWTRVLAAVVGSSIYAFSIMLATFLLGIAVGSYLFSLAAKRMRIDLFAFSIFQMLTAASVVWGLNLFDRLPFWFVRFYALVEGHPVLMEAGRFLLCAVVMFVPTVFIGAIFTCFVHIYRKEGSMGRDVGSAYFANTLGTILGAASAGFLFIPLWGVQNTLVGGAVTNGIVGLTAFIVYARNYRWKRLAPFAFATALLVVGGSQIKPWNTTLFASDIAVKPGMAAGLSREEFYNTFREREILFYKEGITATVSVTRNRDNLSMAVNGKTDASNRDAFTQYLLGHLPMMLHENPEKVLIIGLGSASTVTAVAGYPVEVIDAVEVEKAVIEAARYFKEINRDVLNDPRVRMFVNDGRNILLLRPDRYDVIISEPSNPWMAGVASLFSLEHFKTMKSRLNEGGIVCQWLHAYSMSTEDLAMIIRTFTEAFEHTQLWTSYFPDLILMGFESAPSVDFHQIEKRYREVPFLENDLAPHGSGTPASFFSSYWLSDAALRELSSGAPLNTDNKPLLEFSAPRYLYADYVDANYSFLNAGRDFDYDFLKIDPPAGENAGFLAEIGRGLAEKKMMGDAQGAILRAVRRGPEHPSIPFAAGVLNYHAGNFDDAKNLLESARSHDPDSLHALYYGAKILIEEGDRGEAVSLLDRAVSLNPPGLEWKRKLAEAFLKAEVFQEADRLYREILEETNFDFSALNNRIDIALREGRNEQAIGLLEEMTAQYPRFAPPYMQLGRFYEEKNKLQEAAQAYETFLEVAPETAGAWLSLARVSDRRGERSRMVEALRRAADLEPELRNHPEISRFL